jgi:hypothetical protein
MNQSVKSVEQLTVGWIPPQAWQEMILSVNVVVTVRKQNLARRPAVGHTASCRVPIE